MDENDTTNQIPKKFLEIYRGIDRDNPTDQNLNDLEGALADTRTLSLQTLSHNNILTLLKKTYGRSGINTDALLRGVDRMRQELGYDNAPGIEQLLIDEIILEFFRSHQMQLSLTALTTTPGISPRTIQHFDTLASAAQRRLHKAILTFTKIRKAGVNLQINIAAELF